MGRKKRPQQPAARPFRPFCYFCDKEYPDEAKLVNHQRAVHFKCPFCVKRLDDIRGLLSHALDVHREIIDAVPNALRDRRNIDVVGMRGVPSSVIADKAIGTDLERFIADDQIDLHPVFASKNLNND